MSDLTRVAAFIEYVVRPMSEDWRIILEKAKELNVPITEQLMLKLSVGLGFWHLLGETLRAITYILITWIICQTLISLWPIHL